MVGGAIGGATRGAQELVAGASRTIAVTEDYLAHGAPSDEVSTDLFQPDKLHLNANGYRRWASCLEAELSAWSVQRR